MKTLTAVFLLLLGGTAISGEIKVSVSSEKIDIKETITVKIHANFESDSIHWPTFEDFVMVEDPGTGVSSTNNNGHKTYSITRTYHLRAKRPGTIKLPTTTFYVDGKKMTSEVKSIRVSGNPLSQSDLDELEVLRLQAAEDDSEQKGLTRVVFNGEVGYIEKHDGNKWIYQKRLNEAELKAIQQLK
ncbi:BatD family protein [Crocinitomix catalasitica]|nr:BatD family protein [Crocinitomix catalasitica]